MHSMYEGNEREKADSQVTNTSEWYIIGEEKYCIT